MPAETVQIQRRSNLALSFQEIFTAVVRLRFNRQTVPSADSFREHMRQGLRTAYQDAVQKGYAPEDAKIAGFAVIAFLDESVLASSNPVFSTWSRLPLQEELFGHHMGGEAFFQYAQQLLERRDSNQTADLLEVLLLCILLGYRGRFGIGNSGELRSIVDNIRDKIQRVRDRDAPMSPQWALPNEAPLRKGPDPWVRILAIGAAAMALLAVGAYGIFAVGLMHGASMLHALSG